MAGIEDRRRRGDSYSAKRRRIKQYVDSSWKSVLEECSKTIDQEVYVETGPIPTEAGCSDVHNTLPCNTTDSDVESEISESFEMSFECSSQNNDIECGVHGHNSEGEATTSQSHLDKGRLFGGKAAEWALKHNLTHVALRELFEIVRCCFHVELPIDPRTLLQTPRNYNVKDISGDGKYFHFGIASGIELLDLSHIESNHLKLQFNIDGLPLFKSSSTEFWPILCLVRDSGTQPFVVGLYSGKKKPVSLQEFLGDFVSDMQQILGDGVIVNGVVYSVSIDCFICDAPARAFVKNVKHHSGYFGCDKCTQEGDYIDGRMTFPIVDAPIRTDAHFDELRDEDHHRGLTPLRDLNIGLVTSFVLDYMHLVCLGVARKLLHFWLSGPIRKDDSLASRLPASAVRTLSDRLLKLSSCMPCDFSRKPRSLDEIDRWKATEFRTFLLYTGPVVLRGILPEQTYVHFMLLSTAITLLASQEYCLLYNAYAHQLLVSFVEEAKRLYSPAFIVYNVHALVHLAADVEQYGPLDSFSAFPFENHLCSIKRMVRKCSAPLAQVLRRLSEQRQFGMTKNPVHCKASFELYSPHTNGPLPSDYQFAQQYTRLRKLDTVISVAGGDCCVAVSGSGPMLVRNIISMSHELFLVCQPLKMVKDLYTLPLQSSNLGTMVTSSHNDFTVVIPATSEFRKCVCVPDIDDSQHLVVIPLIHS